MGLKTRPTGNSPRSFIARQPQGRREDCIELLETISELLGEPAKMWGPSIIGFGSYDYIYPSGRQGTWMMTGFSPRSSALTIYLLSGFAKLDLSQLGKFTTGKSCLYIKTLDQINRSKLWELIKQSTQLVGNGDIDYS